MAVVIERLIPAATLNAASAVGSCENPVSCGSVDPVDVGRWMWSEEMIEGLLGNGFIISLGWLFRGILWELCGSLSISRVDRFFYFDLI